MTMTSFINILSTLIKYIPYVLCIAIMWYVYSLKESLENTTNQLNNTSSELAQLKSDVATQKDINTLKQSLSLTLRQYEIKQDAKVSTYNQRLDDVKNNPKNANSNNLNDDVISVLKDFSIETD